MMHVLVLACTINADNLYETRSLQRIVQLLPTFSYRKFDDQVSTSHGNQYLIHNRMVLLLTTQLGAIQLSLNLLKYQLIMNLK